MIHSTSRSFAAFLLFFSVFILPSVIRAQTFEGEITMQMSSPMMGNQKIDMMYSVKGDKVVQTADDPKVGKITAYTDTKTGTVVIVQEAYKKGMEIDQATMDEALKGMNMPILIPVPTGKTEKIAGYNCELYTIVIDTAQEMSLWLTKDLPPGLLRAIGNCTEAGMKNTGVKSDALMTLLRSGYAQVRMEMKYKGITQLTNEFVKAEAKKLDNSIFTVPSDVTVNKYDPKSMMGAPPEGGGKQ